MPSSRATRWSTSGSSTTASTRSLLPALQHASDLRSSRARARVPRSSSAPSPAAAATPSVAAAVGQRDQHDPRLDELLQRAGRRATSSGSSSTSEASALPISLSDSSCAQPARRRLVQARVLDRDRRLRGEELRELLVLVGEVGAAGLLGEVEVPVGDAAQHDRDAEEGLHRRMVGREADRARVFGDLVQSQRLRVTDEHAEDPSPPRQLADRGMRLGVDTRGEEALEPMAGRSITPRAA